MIFNHRAEDPVAELSHALLSLVNSPERQARLRLSAWSTARGYTLTKIARELVDDFQSLLEPSPALATSVPA